jgi:hypothetical protein
VNSSRNCSELTFWLLRPYSSRNALWSRSELTFWLLRPYSSRNVLWSRIEIVTTA